MTQPITITTKLTFRHVGGDILQPAEGLPVEDFILDALAAEIGKQNGARKPLRFTVTDNYVNEATYELDLVSD